MTKTIMTKTILLYGNDATGKTSICGYLNEQRNVKCYTRGFEGEYTAYLKAIDSITLKSTTDEASLPDLESTYIDSNGKQHQIERVILDANINVLNERIGRRKHRDEWESMRALHYFRYKFLQLGLYYGIPIVDTEGSVEESANKILNIVDNDTIITEFKHLALSHLTQEKIRASSLHNHLLNKIGDEDQQTELILEDVCRDSTFDRESVSFMIDNHQELRRALTARYQSLYAKTKMNQIHFELINEGESKQVFKLMGSKSRFFDDKVFICLKPTIYSHSKQSTGEIKDLTKIRAEGTKHFLEILHRNEIDHAYYGVNQDGVVIAKEVKVTNLEVCFKSRCEGTDKHSYHSMLSDKTVCLDTGEYLAGPYIRYDWRNPNHVNNEGGKASDNPYYHILEKFIGKDIFFDKYVRSWTSLGDRTISPDLAESVQDIEITREYAMKTFLTMQSYLEDVGLALHDGCIMCDKSGKLVWSEINQDCMRIKGEESFDKDIWRVGGSSPKEDIIAKWGKLNDILRNYLERLQFHRHEMICKATRHQLQAKKYLQDTRLSLSKYNTRLFEKFSSDPSDEKARRRVLVTMDLFDGKPVTVKQGKIQEVHSQGSISEAMRRISIFPDILLVDLNRALNKEPTEISPNKEIIQALAKQYYVHVGGGLRTIEAVQEMLENSVRRVVISTNTEESFISAIPKERLIVELTIKKDEVLIFGRSQTTRESLQSLLTRLGEAGVEAISFTMHMTEGDETGAGIDRRRVMDIISIVPDNIKKIYVGGGISSIADLKFFWSMDHRIIPVLGSAIWSGRLKIAHIMRSMLHFDENGVLPAIIQDTDGIVLGLIYMNQESMELSVEKRELYRYSRRLKRVLKKGAVSNNVQKIVKIVPDCDCDAILIIVEANTRSPFCHSGNQACFSNQSVLKSNVRGLVAHIGQSLTSNNDETYSKHMQQNPCLALAKVMEELWEVMVASQHRQVPECADLFAHLFMYVNGMEIHIDSITNELNARRWNPKILSKYQHRSDKTQASRLVLGVAKDKYSDRSDDFLDKILGISLKRQTSRDLRLTYDVHNRELYKKYFGDAIVSFIPMRPKDMPLLISYNVIDGAIAYNSVMENLPNVAEKVVTRPDDELQMALVCRNGNQIDHEKWSIHDKAHIAAEHVWTVNQHLRSMGISEEVYSLQRVLGCSESFLANDSKHDFVLADAIISSGSTLVENKLKVWQIMKPKGSVTVGLYLKTTETSK